MKQEETGATVKSAVQPTDWAVQRSRPQYQALERVAVEDDWFAVYRVEPGVYAIYEPGNFQEVISYLVTGTQRALLIDTGMGMGDMARLVKQLTPLPVAAVNTHCHFDHVGRNWQFAEGWYWPAPPSHASAQQGQTHAQVGEYVAEGCNCAPYPADFCPKQYAILPYPHWQPLREEQLFELGGRTVRVQHAPGHSPDSIVLADDANKLLFTGDTYYPAPLYTHMHSDTGMNGDFWQFRATVQALAGRYADYTLYTGHNEPRRSGAMLCATADAFDAVVRGQAPYEADEDGLRRYTWNDVQILTAPGGPPAPQSDEKAGGNTDGTAKFEI